MVACLQMVSNGQNQFIHPKASRMIESSEEQTTSDFNEGEISHFQPGQIFAGYRLISKLGTGGNGAVFLAESCTLNERVALKILHGQTDSGEVQRFKREARLCSRLNDEHLVKYKSFGVESQHCYLVMEYVDGESLQQYLKDKGRLSAQLFVQIFLRVCSGLASAHGMNILHRDIKPANILISAEQGDINVKIVDFGLAKELGGIRDQGSTTSGAIRGSPLYMSPEQCRGSKLDARSDIYSLGCTMFECLSGKPPFEADSSFSIMAKHLQEPARFPDGISVSAELSRLVLACLEKEPLQRIQSMTEIENCLRGLDTTKLQRLSKSAGKRTTATRGPAFIVVACLMLALGVLAILHTGVLRSGMRPEPAEEFHPIQSSSLSSLHASKVIFTKTASADNLLSMAKSYKNDRGSDLLLQILLAAAKKSLEKGELENALEAYSELLAVRLIRHENDEREKALVVMQVLLAQNLGNVRPEVVFRARKEAAFALCGMYRYEEALSEYKKALKLLDTFKSSPVTQTLRGEVFESMATTAETGQQFKLAYEYAQKAYELASEEKSGERLIKVARNAYLSNEDKLWKSTLQKILTDSTEADDRAAIELTKLGEVLVMRGNYREARTILLKAKEIFRSAETRWHYEYGLCFYWLGLTEFQLANLKEAEQCCALAEHEFFKQSQQLKRVEAEVLRDEEWLRRIRELRAAVKTRSSQAHG